jgi:hypothetical protein
VLAAPLHSRFFLFPFPFVVLVHACSGRQAHAALAKRSGLHALACVRVFVRVRAHTGTSRTHAGTSG